MEKSYNASEKAIGLDIMANRFTTSVEPITISGQSFYEVQQGDRQTLVLRKNVEHSIVEGSRVAPVINAVNGPQQNVIINAGDQLILRSQVGGPK